MAEHAILAPSASDRWFSCPGSVAATAGLDDPSSIYADEGTFYHEVAAQCLRDGKPARFYVGEVSDCARFEVTAENADHLQTYLDTVGALEVAHFADTVDVEVKAMAYPPNVWGTCDVRLWSKGRLDIVDLKFGAGIWVDVEDNSQLLIYAVGALRDTDRDTSDVQTIGIHVVQPRCRGKAHRWVEVTRAELEDFEDLMKSRADEAMRPNAPRLAGEWCRFCLASGRCEAQKNAALHEAAAVFEDASQFVTKDTPPDLADLSSAKLASAFNALPAVQNWIKGVQKEAERRLQAGEKLPGLKLVRKQSNRSWRNLQDAAAVMRRHGVNPYGQPPMLSPAQAEKAASAKAWEAIKEHVVRKDAGTGIAAASDPRPDYDPAAVFAADLLGE